MTNSSDTNRDKALRREVVVVTDARLREMQEQAIRFEGVGEGTYHWHWAAVMNELIARRASDEPFEHLCPHGMPLAENVCGPCSKGAPNKREWNFDRYRNGQLMAQGIMVHAANYAAAYDNAVKLLFTDGNKPTDELRLSERTGE